MIYLTILRNLFLTIVSALLTTLGVAVSFYFLRIIFWGHADSLIIIPAIFAIFFPLTYVIFSLKTVIYCFMLRSTINRALAIRNEKGYCDEYFDFLDCARKKGGKRRRFRLSLTLASELADAERYEEAEKVLYELADSAANLGKAAGVDYANACIYIFLIQGKTELAEIAVAGAGQALYDTAQKKSNGGAINHTLGVLEYAKGNLSRAESLLVHAKAQASSVYSKNACDMYLALIYLKTDRREYAKKAVSGMLGNISNPRQASDVKRLMALVEQAYGF